MFVIENTDKPWHKFYSKEALETKLPEKTIYEFLRDNNQNNLNKTAICYLDKEITYRELFENIEAAAKGFAALGLKKGDVVVIASITTPEVIYSFYALNRLGAIPNMVDPRTSSEGIHDYIEESDAKCVVSLNMCFSKVSEACKNTSVKDVIVISPVDSLPLAKRAAFSAANRVKGTAVKLGDNCLTWRDFIKKGANTPSDWTEPGCEDCCVIVHTGGTTGSPKGVMLSSYNLNASVVQGTLSGFDFQREHIWLSIMPPFIAYGICNGIHMPLYLGMTLVVIPDFDPEQYDELLLKYKPQHIVGVPAHYTGLIQSKKMANADLSFLRSPIVGGDAMEIGLEREVNEFLLAHHCPTKIIKGYGMTEACAAVCTTAKPECNKEGSVGIPLSHSIVGIFDTKTGEELPCGEVGEICIRSANVMLGYYNNQAETDNILRRHEDGLLWIHSGDFGYMDEDGAVFIKDRIKRLIVRVDGFKVFPTMIEDTISEIPEVSSCCAVGVKDPHASQGKLPVVFVSIKSGFEEKREEILDKIGSLSKKKLPEYAVPIAYYTVENMPLTPIGKIDFRYLEQLASTKEL